MKLISKNVDAKIHALNETAGLIPDSAIKHWSMCGNPFYSWRHREDEFHLFELSNDDVCKYEDEKLCKRCFPKESLLRKEMTSDSANE